MDSPMTMEYTFAKGSKSVCAVNLWQGHDPKSAAGKINIRTCQQECNDDGSWQSVTSPSKNGFSSTRHNEKLIIDFASVRASKIRLDIHPHDKAQEHIRITEIEIESCEAKSESQ